MLTRKQYELLLFIHQKLRETGISPSFEEMKDAVNLRSKSGIHRLILALEERGYLRRLPYRARALEILRVPPPMDVRHSERDIQQSRKWQPSPAGASAAEPAAGSAPASGKRAVASDSQVQLGVMGRIAAGTPIEALQHELSRISVPQDMIGAGRHYALEIYGDSMINAGILDGDTAIIRECDTAETGDIVVALIDGQEATLKRLRRKGDSIALEAANPNYETQIVSPERLQVQGKLVGVLRRY